MPGGAGYAVWGKLDSLNDSPIPAENRHFAAHLRFLPPLSII
jgi:hypothetical protein